MPQRIFPRATGIVTGSGANPTWDSMVNFLGEGRNRYGQTYTVFRDGALAYGQNGETGALEFSGADHDAVIQSCIDAIETAAIGGEILIRGGEYTCDAALDIDQSNLTIRFEPSVTMTFSGVIDGFSVGDAVNQVFRCFFIGNMATLNHSGAGGLRAIDFYDTHNSFIDGFRITNWEDSGIYARGSWTNNFVRNQISACEVGIKLVSSQNFQSNQIGIYQNEILCGENRTANIELDSVAVVASTQNVNIKQNVIGDCPVGILDHYSDSLVIENNYFESNMALDTIDYWVRIQGDDGTSRIPKILYNRFDIGDAVGVGVQLEAVNTPIVAYNVVHGAAGANFIVSTGAASQVQDISNLIFNPIAVTNVFAAGTLVHRVSDDGIIVLPNAVALRGFEGTGTTEHPLIYLSNLNRTVVESIDQMDFLLTTANDMFRFRDNNAAEDLGELKTGTQGGGRIRFGDKNGVVVGGDFEYDPTAGNGFEFGVYDYANGRVYFYGNGGVHYMTQTAGVEFGQNHKKCALSNKPFEIGDVALFVVDRFQTDGVPHAVPIKLSEALEKLGYKK